MTQDTSPRPLAGEGQGVRATETAVDPKTWKKLVLLAPKRTGPTARGTTSISRRSQPPEWIGEHDVRIGASIALPLDLVEMGLPADLHATVIAVEHCPEIDTGPGRVVLTTVNHLNKYVFELTIKNASAKTKPSTHRLPQVLQRDARRLDFSYGYVKASSYAALTAF